tara:strand:+ start:2207 stop:3262 length:1056 start_codon:yes stop_codon:yes gene_type:complete
MKSHIWLRSETKDHERRTPLTPIGAKQLIQDGHSVTVEKCNDRIIKDIDYQNVGCRLVDSLSWKTAPKEAIILGLKELPENESDPLVHKHIFFGHAYKGQAGATDLLKRFKNGGGCLYDLEYLIDENQRRVAAFGFWAGFTGAAAAMDSWADLSQGKEFSPLHDYEHQDEWISALKKRLIGQTPNVMVVGAKGRCGSGALTLLKKIGIFPTSWDYQETKEGGPFKKIAEHDVFINTALINTKIPPFINEEILEDQALSIICDVSCDPSGELNPIPLYDRAGSWQKPLQSKLLAGKIRHILAVDNLPSLLPKESSEDFAEQLLPHLRSFANDHSNSIFERSLAFFKNYSDKI